METRCDLQVEIERFVEVALSIVVQVLELPQSIAARDINVALNNLEPKRVIETARKSSPSDILQITFEPRYDEDVTMECADRGATVGKEIKARSEERRVGKE